MGLQFVSITVSVLNAAFTEKIQDNHFCKFRNQILYKSLDASLHFNPLKYGVPPDLTSTLYILLSERIYGFHMILRINSDYFSLNFIYHTGYFEPVQTKIKN
jgi:hypothetical protein